MTRIIAGRAGGRTLRTPPGSRTRPTSDRVREALFSSLQARDAVDGAVVLDLYAGSGALGLEALSRGALRAIFVDDDRRAASVVRDNLTALGLTGQVHQMSTASFLARPAEAVDLVLIDPPYDLTEEALAAVLGALDGGWLADGATVVVERSARSPEPRWPTSWTLARSRRYGETAVWITGPPSPD